MAINWKIETRTLDQLKSHPSNPRKLSKHDAEHLQKSIEKFGLIDKPIINTDNTIIGGHQRVEILRRMKIKEVECYVPDHTLSQKEVDELCLRLNKNIGEWDWDLLANEWETGDLLEWGFNEEELCLNAGIEEIESEETDETLHPGKDEDATTKMGDVIGLGSHRLVCGDSCDPAVVAACLSGQVPILMVTDPPYGVEYDSSWRDKLNKRKDGSVHGAHGKVQNDSQVNWALAWHLFPGSVAYVWHAGKFCSEVQKSLEEAEYQIIGQIIWAKQHFALSRGDYHWQHEPCWYAVKKGHNHNWQGARDQATLWEISNLNAFGENQEDERTAHSTQKPLECMRRPIRNNTAEEEGVYDPFLGSGTSLIAADQLNRVCYGIEISPAYCDLIVKRFLKYRTTTGKDAIIKKNGQITEEYNG